MVVRQPPESPAWNVGAAPAASSRHSMMNDALRILIDRFIGASAIVFRGILFMRMKTYRWNQARLRCASPAECPLCDIHAHRSPFLKFLSSRFLPVYGLALFVDGRTFIAEIIEVQPTRMGHNNKAYAPLHFNVAAVFGQKCTAIDNCIYCGTI